MRRKRIVRRIAGTVMGLLVIMTAVSSLVYNAMMPRVTTCDYIGTVGRLLDGYSRWEILSWVPVKCTFPVSQEDQEHAEDLVRLYQIAARSGQWSPLEYYVEEIEAPVLKRGDDILLLESGHVGYFATLVCETNLPLHDGDTVKWLNPGEIR